MATRKKRQNPFITFMGKCRKTNKGKYDFKQMGREAGKAWHKVKGGAGGAMSKACIEDVSSSACAAEMNKEIALNAGELGASPKARALLGIKGGRRTQNRRTQKRRR